MFLLCLFKHFFLLDIIYDLLGTFKQIDIFDIYMKTSYSTQYFFFQIIVCISIVFYKSIFYYEFLNEVPLTHCTSVKK